MDAAVLTNGQTCFILIYHLKELLFKMREAKNEDH